jgi:hypothetical protein
MYNGEYECTDFLELYLEMDSISFENNWPEFSWNRYSDSLLDYGEKSEWEIYVEEERERDTL